MYVYVQTHIKHEIHCVVIPLLSISAKASLSPLVLLQKTIIRESSTALESNGLYDHSLVMKLS